MTARIFMDAAVTLTEVMNRVSNCCRLCRSPGNLVECLLKIYLKSQIRKTALAMCWCWFAKILVSLCKHMCNPCARKIRNSCHLNNEIEAVTTSREAAEVSSSVRSKRQLPTSVCSPDNFFSSTAVKNRWCEHFFALIKLLTASSCSCFTVIERLESTKSLRNVSWTYM